jgi:tellurite resistance protein
MSHTPKAPAGTSTPAHLSGDEPQGSRLSYLPISFFAMVMGLAGLTIAWAKAGHVLGLDPGVALGLLVATTITFAALLGLYAAKFVLHRHEVIAELGHPVKISFFPTIAISFLLLAIATLAVDTGSASTLIARGEWLLGTVLLFGATLHILSLWMHHDRFRVHHLNPAWFIPAVGNVVVPVAGVPLGYIEISWFFFSIGIVLWIVLLTLVLYRMFFHDPIEARLLPSLFILIAPPAVGFIALTRLQGELDADGRVLYFFGLFMAFVVLSQARRFVRLPFGLPAWAYSFPLAAITIATLLMYELTDVDAYRWLGVAFLVLLNVVVTALLVRTFVAVRNRQICVPGT